VSGILPQLRNESLSADEPADPDLRAIPTKGILRRLFSGTASWVFLIDIALILVFWALSSQHSFLSLTNVQALLLGGTEALLLSLGLALLLGAGIIDFSLGANLVVSSVTGSIVIQHIAGSFNSQGNYHAVGLAIFLGFAAAIATGVLFGFINGLVISYVGINPLIATLGTAGIGTGIALVITNGGDVSGLPTQLQQDIGLKTVADIPLPAMVAILLAVVMFLIIRFTRFGMRSLAMGSSRAAAERSGINVRLHALRLTMLAGALAGLAGFVDVARFGATTTSGHTNDALNALTAVIIGGTLLEGGRVSIIGAIWGTGLAVMLQEGLVVIGVQAFYQLIAVGAVLILAVSIDRFRYRRRRA
jgi:ribose transport system permease protein